MQTSELQQGHQNPEATLHFTLTHLRDAGQPILAKANSLLKPSVLLMCNGSQHAVRANVRKSCQLQSSPRQQQIGSTQGIGHCPPNPFVPSDHASLGSEGPRHPAWAPPWASGKRSAETDQLLCHLPHKLPAQLQHAAAPVAAMLLPTSHLPLQAESHPRQLLQQLDQKLPAG